MLDMLHWWIDDPMGSIVKMQADLGMDPMIWTHSQHIGESEIWPRMLIPRPLETDTWHEIITQTARGDRAGASTSISSTHPPVTLTTAIAPRTAIGTASHDFLLKGDEPEQKLEAFRYFPSGRGL